MKKGIDYYLSIGMEQKYAEYYAGGRKRIISVTANDDYSLLLHFDNCEKRIYNVLPLMNQGSVFAPLNDMGVFKRVYLDEQSCVSWDIDPSVDSDIVWGNKIDLCPDSCYVDSVPV